MAPRKKRTTSADRSRNKGKGAKKVTGKTPQSRANRQRTSTARVTQSGQGGGRGRVTNASQRTSTGSARVTGKPQLALPPGKKGGSLVKPKSQTSRQAAARVKAAKAAKGTKGGTRVGQPAGSANRMYGANVVNKAVNRATKAAKNARRLSVGRGGLATLALMAANKVQDRMLSPAARKRKRENEIRPLTMADMPGRSKGKPGPNKGPGRVRPTTPYYGPGGSPSGSGAGQARQRKPAGTSGVTSRKSGSSTKARPAAVAAPKKAATPKKTAPKKKTSGVSGVGPVASGRTYSVQKTGKSVMQQQADELRAMRKRSVERQKADKAKLNKKKK